MPSIVLYLLKCSISLAIVWLFYQLLLRRLTFYAMNRWYLMAYAGLSFLVPLIHIVLPAEEEMAGNMEVIRYIPVLAPVPAGRAPEATAAYTAWDIVLAALFLGALLLLARLLIRYLSLRRIRKGARLIQGKELAVYHVDQPIIPFSFGRAIYLNPRLHTEKEYEEIILHEYVHVCQRHTVDILVAELLCIVSWFNPFSWMIRHCIRQNLEFIADRQVLASGLDRKAYQYHLLKVVGEPRYRLANNFNFSSLKKRIVMMNKSKSAKLHLFKFLFIVPLLGVLLVAFRDKVDIHLPAAIFHETAAPIKAGDRIIAEPPRSMAAVDTIGHPKKDTLRKLPEVLVRPAKDTTKPMYVIDEVEVPLKSLRKLDPVDISFMDVLKDDLSGRAFGPRAKGGVVLIYTKAYAPNRKGEVTLIDGNIVRYTPHQITPGRDTLPAPIKDTAHTRDLGFAAKAAVEAARDVADTSPFKSVRESLIVVDGKPSDYRELGKIDPDKIESITILRSKAAEAIYGPKAEKGVMIVALKKPGSSKTTALSGISYKDETITMKADSIRITNP